MLAGAYANYRAATVFVRTAYDQRLADAARTLALNLQAVGSAQYAGPLRYSIVAGDGNVIAGPGTGDSCAVCTQPIGSG